MPLTMAQIQSLLSEAVAAGLDADEVEALRLTLLDRAAELDGGTRLDMALALADDAEIDAANQFMQDAQQIRTDAIQRGIETLNNMSDAEWERLLNAKHQ